MIDFGGMTVEAKMMSDIKGFMKLRCTSEFITVEKVANHFFFFCDQKVNENTCISTMVTQRVEQTMLQVSQHSGPQKQFVERTDW